MLPEYKEALKSANLNKKGIINTAKRLRKMRKGAVDDLIQPLHDEAFEKIDCLKCANCCKTSSPLFTERDISRIAKHFKMKEAAFVVNYLTIDEEEDFVLQETPCTFLGDDNYCTIYDVRPRACAEYPHTDQVNQLGIMSLTMKNATICPAVAQIFEKLK